MRFAYGAPDRAGWSRIAIPPVASEMLEGAPAATVAPTVTGPQRAEVLGTMIGPYKLLQQIGEGGMGVVYMAEQMHPVQRRVALKLIRPGLDSRAIVARIEDGRLLLDLRTVFPEQDKFVNAALNAL